MQASYPLLRLFHRYTKKESEAKLPPLPSIWLKLPATADAKPIPDESILKMCIIYIFLSYKRPITHSHAVESRVNVFWLLLLHGMSICVDGTSMCSPATTLLNIARRCCCRSRRCRRRRCFGIVYVFAAFVCKHDV